MGTLRLVVHRDVVLYFTQLHPHCRPVLRSDRPRLVGRSAANALALVLLLEAVQSSLRDLAVFKVPLTLTHGLVEVLCEHLFFLQVRDVTRTVIR